MAIVETLTFTKTNYPEVLEVVNEIAELEARKPHDSARLLILEAGKSKIKALKEQLGIVPEINPSPLQEGNGNKSDVSSQTN